MKELRKRVNGLIAILLAVCMSLEMSGEQVAAATTIKFGYDSNIDLSKIESYTPESLQLSEMGDAMKEDTSGGSFVIDKENSASGITDYFSSLKIKKSTICTNEILKWCFYIECKNI